MYKIHFIYYNQTRSLYHVTRTSKVSSKNTSLFLQLFYSYCLQQHLPTYHEFSKTILSFAKNEKTNVIVYNLKKHPQLCLVNICIVGLVTTTSIQVQVFTIAFAEVV
jgi:hypothetical protein